MKKIILLSFCILLLAGMADAFVLDEGAGQSISIGSSNYELTLTYMDSDEAVFIINGEQTTKIKAGESYYIKDGYITVNNLIYQQYAGGKHQVTFDFQKACDISDIFKLEEGTTKTVQYLGDDYEITLTYMDIDEAVFIVNGKQTNKLKKGFRHSLGDDVSLTVDLILYQQYAGGRHYVTFRVDSACNSNPADSTPKADTTYEEKDIAIYKTNRYSELTLQEGESKHFFVGKNNYEIMLSYVDANEAVFAIGDVQTRKLKNGESYTFNEDLLLTVSNILYQQYAGGKHQATFKLEKICNVGNIVLLNEGETNTMHFAGVDYKIMLLYIGNDETILLVNGQKTSALKSGFRYSLKNNIFLSIRNIVYQNFAGGKHQVTFRLELVCSEKAGLSSLIPSPEPSESYQACNIPVSTGLIAAITQDPDAICAGGRQVGPITTTGGLISFTVPPAFVDANGNPIANLKPEAFFDDENNVLQCRIPCGLKVKPTCLKELTSTNYDENIVDGSQCNSRPQVVIKPIPLQPGQLCIGCERENKCLQYGIRMLDKQTPVYCDIDGELRKQKPDNDQCQNSYECVSNSCGNGKCRDIEERIQGIEKQLEKQGNILEKILDFFRKLFV